MKILWLCVFFFVSLNFAHAQHRITDEIYWDALESYTRYLDSTTTGKKVIYLEQRDFIDSIPSIVNGYQIIPITSANKFKLYKEHNNKLIHTTMSPVEVEYNTLRIVFIPFFGTLKGRHFYLANGGGATIYFKLDTLTQQFIVFRIERWGI